MATIRHHTYIDRTPDVVWKTVVDSAALSAWFPGIETSTAEGNLRRCTMGGAELVEEIVTADEELRRFQYRIVGGAFTVEFHLATIDVLPDGEGSLVIYSTEVLPDDAKALMEPALASGLQGLKTYLES